MDRQGRGGGVAVLRKRDFNCQVVSYSPSYIDLEVKDDSQGRCV